MLYGDLGCYSYVSCGEALNCTGNRIRASTFERQAGGGVICALFEIGL